MLRIHPGPDDHEKFKKLCALAVAGCLAPLESVELQAHLKHCESCHEVFKQYQILTTQGIMALAEDCSERSDESSWGTPVLEHVLARVRTDLLLDEQRHAQQPSTSARAWLKSVPVTAWYSLAAGFVLALTLGAYHLGLRSQKSAHIAAPQVASAPDNRLLQLLEEKRRADEMLAAQTRNLAQLEADRLEKGKELARVRAALNELEDRWNRLQAATGDQAVQLSSLAQQRNTLTTQLQALNQSYEANKAELSVLRSERDGMLLRTSTLETKVSDLTSLSREQERRLNDDQQYLSSDRDIRELMGARKLYIADVFDVDGSSRTQRPFGRVFYTQGKSLIFYAFDLDHQPKVVNASSTFQVWGQREAPQGEQAIPMNLGILYLDSEANRRWVMRFDDPKQLAEIDAVFVTVEPHGGSRKPTSKPLLYALLRKEANHP